MPKEHEGKSHKGKTEGKKEPMIPQHKKMAMGEKVTGMKSGGKACMKKGGKAKKSK